MPTPPRPGEAGYGTAPEGSLSEERAKRASIWVEKEVFKLLVEIESLGRANGNEIHITFGELFLHYQDVSDTLVGIMARAKKRGLLKYEGEGGHMLFQGRHDKVLVTMDKAKSHAWKKEYQANGTVAAASSDENVSKVTPPKKPTLKDLYEEEKAKKAASQQTTKSPSTTSSPANASITPPKQVTTTKSSPTTPQQQQTPPVSSTTPQTVTPPTPVVTVMEQAQAASQGFLASVMNRLLPPSPLGDNSNKSIEKEEEDKKKEQEQAEQARKKESERKAEDEKRKEEQATLQRKKQAEADNKRKEEEQQKKQAEDKRKEEEATLKKQDEQRKKQVAEEQKRKEEELKKKKEQEKSIPQQQQPQNPSATNRIMALFAKQEEENPPAPTIHHTVHAALPQRTRDGTRGAVLRNSPPQQPPRPLSVSSTKSAPSLSIGKTTNTSSPAQEDWAKKHISRGVVVKSTAKEKLAPFMDPPSVVAANKHQSLPAPSNVTQKANLFEKSKQSSTLPTGLKPTRFAWE